MFAPIQPHLKLTLLSLTLEAYAAELLSSLWEGGKNKIMQLVLGRVESHPFSLFVFIAPKMC
jgi:hypothetical protein